MPSAPARPRAGRAVLARTVLARAVALGAALSTAAATACTETTPPIPPAPKTYVLVHGAWQSQWNWDEVKANLQARGDTVITLDLPAHGRDTTPAARATLAGYRDAVVAAIGNRTHVILVAHSAGGMTASAVAEAVPERLAEVVYVAAFLPRDGDALLALSQEPANAGSALGQYFVANPAAGVATLKPEGLVPLFCADCDAAHQAAILARPQPEPLAPQVTPVALTAARYGAVPKVYVETLQDRNVTHALQLLMLSRTPVQQRFQLASSHAPMLSMPGTLADLLAGL